MSDPAVAAQRQQQRQQGLIAGLVTLPFRFFGVLCGALLPASDRVSVRTFWLRNKAGAPRTGHAAPRAGTASTHFTRSALVQEPGAPRTVWLRATTRLFVKSGPVDWIRDAHGRPPPGSHRPTKRFPLLHRLGLQEPGALPDRGRTHDAGSSVRLLVLSCLTLPLFLMAARRAGGRPGAPTSAAWRGTRIRVRSITAPGPAWIPLAVLPTDFTWHCRSLEPAADSAAQRAALRRGGALRRRRLPEATSDLGAWLRLSG